MKSILSPVVLVLVALRSSTLTSQPLEIVFNFSLTSPNGEMNISFLPQEVNKAGLIEFANTDGIATDSSTVRAKKRFTRSVETCFLLCLLLCGDINLNLGPVKFPCGLFKRPVKSNHRAIQCDYCNFWFHICCLNMNPIIYVALANTSCV